MDNFNQSRQNGIWGRLENAVLATTGIQRVSLLGGPVLAADDPAYRGVLVPADVLEGPGLPAHRAGTAGPFATYEVTLTDLAQRTALSFDDTLHTAAVATVEPGSVAALDAEPRPVPELAAIQW